MYVWMDGWNGWKDGINGTWKKNAWLCSAAAAADANQ